MYPAYKGPKKCPSADKEPSKTVETSDSIGAKNGEDTLDLKAGDTLNWNSEVIMRSCCCNLSCD